MAEALGRHVTGHSEHVITLHQSCCFVPINEGRRVAPSDRAMQWFNQWLVMDDGGQTNGQQLIIQIGLMTNQQLAIAD